MKKGSLALAGIAILVAGAIVVSSSIGAGGGGKGPYRFHSGVFVVDQSSFARIYVANLTKDEITVSVRFAGENRESLNVAPGDENTATGAVCQLASCARSVEIVAKTPLIVPSLRYTDSTGELQEHLGGTFVATREGKRVP